MQNHNYVAIQGWMFNELELSGNEAIVYAAIYGFTQNSEDWFTGSLNYLSESIRISKRNILRILDKLEQKGLVKKENYKVQNVTLAKYQIVDVCDVIGGDKMSLGWCQNVTGGGVKMSPNNIDNKILEENKKNEISNSSSKEDSLSISCGETSEKVSPPNEKAPEQEAIFLFMPLRTVDENGNSEEVGIPVSWVESMKNLYPDLDVEGEVRKAVAWCLNNPKARKTRAGWQRYLNAWLTRAVDKKSQFPNFEDQKELKRKQEREESIRRGEELERKFGKTLRL